MTPLEFCYWLKGSIEVFGEQALTKEQVEIISKHLALVFENKTKDMKPLSKTTDKERRNMYDALEKELCENIGPLFPDPRGQVYCSPSKGVKLC